MLNDKQTARLADVAPLPGNVIVLRPRILPRHTALLARWLDAGQRMGLCDAHVFSPAKGDAGPDYALVWVRENANPAYMVQPEGSAWVVTDLVRDQVLGRFAEFAACLNFIRPVLALEAAA